MIAPAHFAAVAPAAVEAICNCLVEGSVLASFIWLFLRLAPRRNSGTRFAIWFSTLVAIALLPLLHAWPGSTAFSSAQSSITVPSAAAYWIFWAWLALAGAGLARVAAGLWQIRKLRNCCVEVAPADLHPQLQQALSAHSRVPVSVCTSARLEVPTAIGFFRPVVVVPEWLMKEASPEELAHILLHELAHLRRYDGWTNLAQKIFKAIWFFHPFVWWIERRLSLDREMACDDAVLAQTASPDFYARCLTQIAEKSFLRRQLALAQAAVTRVRQLSLRLAQILSSDRPATTKFWKPAIPLIATLVLVGAAWELHAPRLVNVADDPVATQPSPIVATKIANSGAGQTMASHSPAQLPQPKLALASSKSAVKIAASRSAIPAKRHQNNVSSGALIADSRPRDSRIFSLLQADYRIPAGANYFAYQEVVFTSDARGAAHVQQVSWRLVIWETPAAAPIKQSQKKINPRT